MDLRALRRGRHRTITPDLAQATTDEEACPPEWVDLMAEVDEARRALRARVAEEADRFAAEPDITRALARRERAAAAIRTAVGELNRKVRRLNLVAPVPRFQRMPLDPEELLRPLYRTPRRRS